MDEITYTFSRALHLMRYGGKKMRYIKSNVIYFVKDDTLMWEINGNVGLCSDLIHSQIMGSWVEVKE